MTTIPSRTVWKDHHVHHQDPSGIQSHPHDSTTIINSPGEQRRQRESLCLADIPPARTLQGATIRTDSPRERSSPSHMAKPAPNSVPTHTLKAPPSYSLPVSPSPAGPVENTNAHESTIVSPNRGRGWIPARQILTFEPDCYDDEDDDDEETVDNGNMNSNKSRRPQRILYRRTSSASRRSLKQYILESSSSFRNSLPLVQNHRHHPTTSTPEEDHEDVDKELLEASLTMLCQDFSQAFLDQGEDGQELDRGHDRNAPRRMKPRDTCGDDSYNGTAPTAAMTAFPPQDVDDDLSSRPPLNRNDGDIVVTTWLDGDTETSIDLQEFDETFMVEQRRAFEFYSSQMSPTASATATRAVSSSIPPVLSMGSSTFDEEDHHHLVNVSDISDDDDDDVILVLAGRTQNCGGERPSPIRGSHNGHGTPTTTPTTTEGRSPQTIELSPGMHVTVLPAEETWRAIQEGRITVTACCNCGQELVCIESSTLVVCDLCLTISPVDQSESDLPALDPCAHHGGMNAITSSPSSSSLVGLGIKLDDMMAWMAQER